MSEKHSSSPLSLEPATGEPATGEPATGEQATGRPRFHPPPDGRQASPAAQEPCPTPLAWQEVVRSFDREALIRTYDAEHAELDVTLFGEGPPLLFLPGTTGGPRLFALTIWLLKDDFRCVLVDHPRWKRRPPAEELIPQTSGMAAAVIKHLAPEGIDLFATAYGGQVALELMHRHPPLVKRAVLQSSWAGRELTWTERGLLSLGAFLPLPIRRLPLWLSTQVQNHRRWFPPYDQTRFGFLLNQTHAAPVREVSRRLLACGKTDLRPVLESIRQEVLIVRCEGAGRQIARTEDELARRLPRARTEAMHTTGLVPFLTHPHRLAKLLRGFLTEPAST